MSESEYRFREGHKRKREAEIPTARKRLELGHELTREEVDQIERLVATTVQQYSETIAENAEEFGSGVGELSQDKVEYYLFLDPGDIDRLAGDDFYPADAIPRTSGFVGGSWPADEDVVMDSYPEQIEDDYALPQPEETEHQPERALATETGEESGEELDEDYIDRAAGEIASETLSELLDEVIKEIRHCGGDDPPDAEVLRWLIRGDADIAGSLDAARVETADLLKQAILELSRDASMVEK